MWSFEEHSKLKELRITSSRHPREKLVQLAKHFDLGGSVSAATEWDQPKRVSQAFARKFKTLVDEGGLDWLLEDHCEVALGGQEKFGTLLAGLIKEGTELLNELNSIVPYDYGIEILIGRFDEWRARTSKILHEYLSRDDQLHWIKISAIPKRDAPVIECAGACDTCIQFLRGLMANQQRLHST